MSKLDILNEGREQGMLRKYMPDGMTIRSLEETAGYTRRHLDNLVYHDWNVTVEHVRNYAGALGIEPIKLLEGIL